MIEKYEKLVDDINARKTKIIEEAQREATEILSGSNKLIEHTIKEIKEAEAEKEKTKAIRKKLVEESDAIVRKSQTDTGYRLPVTGKKNAEGKRKKEKVKIHKSDTRSQKYLDGVPVKGDWVEITEYGTAGEVISIQGKTATIQSGSMSIKVPLIGLKKIKHAPKKDSDGFRKSNAYGSIMSDINERAGRFKPTIDLRGKRAIEALDEIKSYIDDAILLSVKEVTILHGKGDGILRNVLREYLQTLDDVEQISDAHVERGGQGITIVRLK
jgi:DNA mismatch repair protein MutS2